MWSLARHRWTKVVMRVYHNVSRASVAVPVVRIGCDHKRQLQQHKQSQLKHWWQPALAMVGAGIFRHYQMRIQMGSKLLHPQTPNTPSQV